MEKEKGLVQKRRFQFFFSTTSRDLSHVDISSGPGLTVSRDTRVRSARVFLSFFSTTMSQHLWLRCEKKEFERRAALSPKNTKALIDAGFIIHVERDEQRIFDDSEYESYAHLYRLPVLRE